MAKCPNCLERKMVEDDKFGEQLKEVEAVEVTHNSWRTLEDSEQKERIKEELIRKGYLKYMEVDCEKRDKNQ